METQVKSTRVTCNILDVLNISTHNDRNQFLPCALLATYSEQCSNTGSARAITSKGLQRDMRDRYEGFRKMLETALVLSIHTFNW